MKSFEELQDNELNQIREKLTEINGMLHNMGLTEWGITRLGLDKKRRGNTECYIVCEEDEDDNLICRKVCPDKPLFH
jgi:hypothetical protein